MNINLESNSVKDEIYVKNGSQSGYKQHFSEPAAIKAHSFFSYKQLLKTAVARLTVNTWGAAVTA